MCQRCYLKIVIFCIFISFFNPLNALETEIKKEPNHPICVLRGVCDKDKDLTEIECLEKKRPIILREITQNIRSISLLETMCPHLHNKDEPYVCCDELELERMFIIVYKLAHVGFNHCPSCLKNLEKLFCQLHCSPKQNQFIHVKETKKNESGDYFASDIDYFINESYALGIFDSCKNVRNSKGKVLDMMCRGLTEDECNARNWFNSIGRSIESHGLSLFKINFKITNESLVIVGENAYHPSAETYIKCSEPLNNDTKACACEHCPDSCSKNSKYTFDEEIETYRSQRKRKSIKEKRQTDKNSNNSEQFPQIEFDSQQEYCIFDGVCSHHSRDGNIPCVRKREPKAISDLKTVEILREICPQLVTNDHPMTCCEPSQIYHLAAAFMLPAKLGLAKCPSCIHNFKQVLCQFACSPRQNQFIRVINTTKLDERNSIIDHLEYYMSQNFAQGLYDSCKSIYNGNLLNMMCGKWGQTKECTPQKWLDFMGLSIRNGGYSPFQMDVKLTTETSILVDGQMLYPMNEKAFSCSESPTNASTPCSCADCEESCLDQ